MAKNSIVERQFEDLFNIRYNGEDVAVGKVLIAEPFLQEVYFGRSVVYLVEHDDEGSVGFVLNKRLPYDTSKLVSELEDIHFPVYLGGPVEQDKLYYLHCRPDLMDALHVKDGIYWGGDFACLVERLKRGQISRDEIRFFAGYSGWGANQLQGELKEDSWIVSELESDTILRGEGEGLWRQALSRLGNRYRVWANFPEDPAMN